MSDLLGARTATRPQLRRLLDSGSPVLAPGAYDALTARLAEAAGFSTVYMTGFGTAASLLGRPDVGLLTATEMADHARRMVAAVDVPVVADADTGYGNPINVIRTVRDYENAGVAALQLEDQVSPKRCGHMAGKAVIPAGEMVAKLEAATAARTDPDLLVIARTDAAAVEGIDAAIERAKLEVQKAETVPRIDNEKAKLALADAQQKLRELDAKITSDETSFEADLSNRRRKREKQLSVR